MRIMIFIFLSVVFNVWNVGWAAPATNVELTYNLETQTLHIDANHPTDRMDRYYIQRVVVSANSASEQTFSFPRQTSPAKFSADLSYSANGGDHIDVKIYSSEGGLAIASLDITRPPEQKKDSNESKTVPNRK